MKTSKAVLLVFFFFTSFLFSQDIIKSDFNIDADGWSVNGGNIYHHNSNGNPDGFIEFEDNQDGAGILITPNKFLGDLRLYKQGTLVFELKNTYAMDRIHFGDMGMLKFHPQILMLKKMLYRSDIIMNGLHLQYNLKQVIGV